MFDVYAHCSTWPAVWEVGSDWPNDGERSVASRVSSLISGLQARSTSSRASTTRPRTSPRCTRTRVRHSLTLSPSNLLLTRLRALARLFDALVAHSNRVGYPLEAPYVHLHIASLPRPRVILPRVVCDAVLNAALLLTEPPPALTATRLRRTTRAAASKPRNRRAMAHHSTRPAEAGTRWSAPTPLSRSGTGSATPVTCPPTSGRAARPLTPATG